VGYITDFVVAPPNQLRAVLARISAPPSGTGFEAAISVNTVELARLWCLLHDEESEEDFDKRLDALDDTYIEDDDGAWAVALPLSFVSELAALSESQAHSATEAWLQSGELEFVPADDARRVLSDLRALAARAVQERGATIIVRVGE
jgi:hypothetical protein